MTKTSQKRKYLKMRELRGNWIRVVRHCPDMTRSYVNDIKQEVTEVAIYLARGSRVSKATCIYDDRDRQWVSCLIKTDNATSLNKRILEYDSDMNFSDVGFRFRNTRINVTVRKRMSMYDKKQTYKESP